MVQVAAVEYTNALQESLLSKLIEGRKALGLSQSDLAERIGKGRHTVLRAESEAADPQLSTFISMALALGLMPALAAPDAEWSAPPTSDLVHRGYAHVRTKHDLDWSDRRREAALSKSWEAANVDQTYGVSPVLPALVPNCTQEQASACATVVQWMGTDVGFEFLSRTLALAGYAIIEKAAQPVIKKAVKKAAKK